MTALINKKNWIYWLLLAIAFVLLLLFYKSKMRSEKIEQELQQGVRYLPIQRTQNLI